MFMHVYQSIIYCVMCVHVYILWNIYAIIVCRVHMPAVYIIIIILFTAIWSEGTIMVVHQFNIIDGMSVDYMHCVLLGVCRLLLRLWFQSCHHKEPSWYISKHLTTIDDRLCSVQPPSEMQRIRRKLTNYEVLERL